MFERLIIRSPFTDDLEGFRDLARRCARAGVTHLTVTERPRCYWEIDDPDDPYLHWSIVHTSLFKIYPPALLDGWAPREFIEKSQEAIREKCAILRAYGLKAAAFFYDPSWWPERVFEKRPELRGPRVDEPRRSVHPRFAPCADHPEVRAMIVESLRRFALDTDGALDHVILRTNDSSTGFCWSDNLYNGPNGPDPCAGRSLPERIVAFHEMLQEAVAGLSIRPHLSVGGGMSPTEVQGLLAIAPAGCDYYIHGNHVTSPVGTHIAGRPHGFHTYPIMEMPNPLHLLNALTDARRASQRRLILFTYPTLYGTEWNGEELPIEVIRRFNESPTDGVVSKVALLQALAAERYGPENAEDVVSAWFEIERGMTELCCYDSGGGILFLGALAQRWITRPLVPFPEELSAEERDYFEPYLFQPDRADSLRDYLNLQGYRHFGETRSLTQFVKHFRRIEESYARAIARFRRVEERMTDPHPEITKAARGFELFQHFLKTIGNTVQFQIQLDLARGRFANLFPEIGGHRTRPGSQREILYTLMRSEMDNALLMARRLETTHHGLMELAETPAEKTPFLLGPDLPELLREKARLIRKHWLDVNRLIPTTEI